MAVRVAWRAQQKQGDPLEGPVRLGLQFAMPRPASLPPGAMTRRPAAPHLQAGHRQSGQGGDGRSDWTPELARRLVQIVELTIGKHYSHVPTGCTINMMEIQ